MSPLEPTDALYDTVVVTVSPSITYGCHTNCQPLRLQYLSSWLTQAEQHRALLPPHSFPEGCAGEVFGHT